MLWMFLRFFNVFFIFCVMSLLICLVDVFRNVVEIVMFLGGMCGNFLICIDVSVIVFRKRISIIERFVVMGFWMN